MPKVSILVPIYNTEKYLKQCLNSLIQQTLKDIEIICIDDGSTDASVQIMDQYAKNDDRFVVLRKKNSGYGDSMNQGLKLAKGEYIGIVEPDDFAEKNMFAELYKLTEKFKSKEQKVDIVRSNYFEYSTQGNKKTQKITENLVGKKLNVAERTEVLRQPPAIWSAIYRREFLQENKIEFLPTPGASFQDTGFFFKTLASAKAVILDDRAFLHYRTDNTASSVKSKDKIDNIVQEYKSIENYLREHKLTKFLPMMEATKFAAYHWNCKRLTCSVAYRFMKKAKKEFLQAKQQGLLQRQYFIFKHWLALQIFLKLPF